MRIPGAGRGARGGTAGVLWIALLIAVSRIAGAQAPEQPLPSPAGADADDQLNEIVVEGRGPRFVAPTRRDQIGRIWAPAFINGRGPFRLVLDTGASQSAVTAELAKLLGLRLDESPQMLLRGVTGTAVVSTVRVETLTVGDLTLDGPLLPIVPDAMGGAEGILGTAGLRDKRIRIDFRRDQITITYSRGERAGYDFQVIPFRALGEELVVVGVQIGSVHAKAIIDTGGQVTIANPALRDALARHESRFRGKPDEIIGATKAVQVGEIIATPEIEMGTIRIRDSGVVFANAYIFTHWHLTKEPAILIGMDALGLLDTLVIDFRRHELQIRASRTD